MTDIRTTNELRGSMTALVTPFHGGQVDFACLERLVDRQIAAGTDWLVALGTTGESPTLSEAERATLLETVIARAAGRRPVMAGTGSNNTAETVSRTRQAVAAGASAALVVAPCYNRPTDEGLFRHFAAVAEAVELPIVLYNVPSRTGADLSNDVAVRLRSAFPNIAALKDACGNVDRVTNLNCRCDIAVLCGDDALAWPSMAMEAVGVISVIANLSPSLMKSLVRAAADGDVPTAQRLHRKVHGLATGLGRFGPNPLPIKTAMAVVGLLEEEFRLPLCSLDVQARQGIEAVLRRHELLQPVNV